MVRLRDETGTGLACLYGASGDPVSSVQLLGVSPKKHMLVLSRNGKGNDP